MCCVCVYVYVVNALECLELQTLQFKRQKYYGSGWTGRSVGG